VTEDQIKALVDRFLAWPLPQSVCSDLCVTDRNYKFPRSGTNLLTASEAQQMIEHLLDDAAEFEGWFREFNSWGLSHDELITCASKPGDDPGDVVWTSPNGSEMTRHVCSRWIEFYGAARAGWKAASTGQEQQAASGPRH
jgi:hypothetical protein